MRIVQKYGGTSVADLARIEAVALRVKETLDQQNQVIVVVSAMAGATNRLVEYTSAFSSHRGLATADRDVVLSSGEQITCGLLALALAQLGIQARSFLGWQVPIVTDETYGNASIRRVCPLALEDCLHQGKVPVIAGFQGITPTGRLTTLGRGGSDTTAVAIAAALKAHRCDIYTDVEGVYTADPRLVPQARLLPFVGYSTMQELASQGAKVLHPVSVDTAFKAQISLYVRSSFHQSQGTLVGPEEAADRDIAFGLTYRPHWVRVRIRIGGEIPWINKAQKIRNLLHEVGIAFDFASLVDPWITSAPYSSSEEKDGREIRFLIANEDFLPAMTTLEKVEEEWKIQVDSDFAQVSLIGNHLMSQVNFVMDILGQKGKNSDFDITFLSSSRLSLGVKEAHAIPLLNALHEAYYPPSSEKKES